MSDNQSTAITRRDALKRGAVIGGALVWATPVVQAVGMGRAFARETSPGCIRYCLKWEADANSLQVGSTTGSEPCPSSPQVQPPLWTNNWVNLGNGSGNVLGCPQGSVNDKAAAEGLTTRNDLEFKVYGNLSSGLWVAFPSDVAVAFLEDEPQRDSGASKCGQGENALTKSELGEEDDPCFEDPNGNPYRRVEVPGCDNRQEISHIELIVDVCS